MRKILSTNNGMTLIEVLMVLVILSIASVSIYSAFTTGLKLYQKIAIEGQLRDDADYIATMILNELYTNTPNYIEPYVHEGESEPSGIRMVRIDKTIDRYVIEDSKDSAIEKVIYFKDNEFFIKDAIEDTEIKISSETSLHTNITKEGVTKASYISLDIENNCSQIDVNGKCQHGVIELNLILEDARDRQSSFFNTEPIELKSTFGF